MGLYVKGGAWSATEDEILKAAVRKYGFQEWERVASLLPKKSAKQAKARWYEWLNPEINKNEWVREEDEKLLTLAKVLPNQWRTIGPLVGRTATQSAERYQQLIDEVVGTEGGDDLGLTGPGIESVPGTELMGLRPEALDTAGSDDETEREMLVEAKARLASNQGKKAKRKAREKLLQESRRLALIQKKRDLKEQGIRVSLKRRKKTKELDYNAEIPHEMTPVAGLHDVDDEHRAAAAEVARFETQVNKFGKAMGDKDKPRGTVLQPGKRAIEGAAQIVNEVAKKPKLELPSTFITTETTVSDATKKHVLAALKSLPAAAHPEAVVMPGISDTAPLNLEDVPGRQLELLRQINAEEASAARSSAVKRGLPIPDPNLLAKATVPSDPLQKAIFDQFARQINSDHREYVDSAHRAPLVADPPVRVYVDEVVSRVQQTIATAGASAEQKCSMPPLPKADATVEAALDTVRQNIATKQAELEAATAPYRAKSRQMLEEIRGLVRELATRTIEVDTHEKYEFLERKAMDRQVATMNRLVDGVVAAEQAAQARSRAT
ncbi:pre-mRNA-splicing factor Cef1p [Diutina catenulata]